MVAAGRAVVQLGAVSLVVGSVLRSASLTMGFLVLMLLVASATAGRRVSGRFGSVGAWFALPMVLGVAPVMVLAWSAGVVPAQPVAVLPIGGILIGGAMSASTLTGRLVLERLRDERGQLEAALAIGLTHPQSVRLVGRPAARLALMPGQDQTRTVGLVTLPGAFIGVLLGGGSTVEAGAAQVLVLVGLLFTQAAAAVVTVELVASSRVRAADGPDGP